MSEEILNSLPYLTEPYLQARPQEVEYYAWQTVMQFWLAPNRNADKIELASRNYRQCLLQEFIRAEFDSNFPKLYKIPHGYTEWFALEARLLGALLRLMERLRALGHLPTKEPMAFLIHRLILERRIVFFCAVRDDFNSIDDGADAAIRTIQHQNRQIQGFENPFPILFNEISGQLIQVAIEISEKNDQFKKQFLNPVVKARSEFSAHARKRKPLVHENGIHKNLRKPKSKKVGG